MSLTPTQLSELQTIVETLRTEFPNSDDDLWQAAIRLQKGGLGPVTGTGGQPAFDAAVADIVEEAEQIATVQGRQGGPGASVDAAVFNVVPIEGELPAGSVGDAIYIDTAPNTYLATDVIEMTPAGPNSVVLSEVGTQVARTVTAANGGLEINNLSTGAGFERVLTTADLGGGTTVNPGTADGETLVWDNAGSQYNASGRFINDEAANRFDFFNATADRLRLTLNATDVRFNWNNSTGEIYFENEVEMRSGDAITFRSSVNDGNTGRIRYNDAAGLEIFTNTGRNIYISRAASVKATFENQHVRIEEPLSILERAAAEFDTAAYGQIWIRNDVPNTLMFTDDAGTDFVVGGALAPTVPAGTDEQTLVYIGTALTATSFVEHDNQNIIRINDQFAETHTWTYNGGGGSILTFTSTNIADVQVPVTLSVIASGGDRMRLLHTNNLVTFDTDGTAPVLRIGFDRMDMFQGAALRFLEVGGLEPMDMSNNGTYVLMSFNAATRGLRLDNSASIYLEERAAANTDQAAYGQLWVRNDTPNVLVFTDDAGTDFVLNAAPTPTFAATGFEIRSAGNTDAEARILEFTHQDSTRRAFIGHDGATRFDVVNEILGANILVGSLDAGGTLRLALNADPDSATEIRGDTDLNLTSAAGTNILQLAADGQLRHEETVSFLQIAAAQADEAGRSQLWARNTSDGELVFTDDQGLDQNLSSSLYFNGAVKASGQLIGLDITGNLYVNISGQSIYLGEKASANIDQAGDGQLWVRSDVPNNLMFTDDSGNDFLVAGTGAGADISAGSNLISGTSFVAVANVSPEINTDYFVMASVEVTAPAADDMNIQFTIDTNARFYGTLTNTEDDSTQIIEGQTAEVVTNNVLVPTSGSATPAGTYVTIIGRLIMGATTGTMSLRCAKNADTGADGFAIRGAIKLIPIDPQ